MRNETQFAPFKIKFSNKVSEMKTPSSRLAKIEKWEFATCTERSRSIANDHFYNERNEEIGIFKQAIFILFPKQ